MGDTNNITNGYWSGSKYRSLSVSNVPLVGYGELLVSPSHTKSSFRADHSPCIHMYQSCGPDAVQCLAHETTYVHSCTGLHLDT